MNAVLSSRRAAGGICNGCSGQGWPLRGWLSLRPLLVHGHVKDICHEDVVRHIDDPLGIQNRPFEQLQLRGKAPKALTNQDRTLVDINEARPVFIHAQRRFERHWNHKLPDSRMCSNHPSNSCASVSSINQVTEATVGTEVNRRRCLARPLWSSERAIGLTGWKP